MKIACTVVGSASVHSDGRGSEPIESRTPSFPSGAAKAGSGLRDRSRGGIDGRCGSGHRQRHRISGSGKGTRDKAVQVGGWGPLFGDEGSAQWIAREGLWLAAHADDETGAPTSLPRILKRHFRLRSFTSIVDAIYADSTPAKPGSLAPLVTNAAVSGDAVARNIFSRAGEALVGQAIAQLSNLASRK